MEYLSFFLSGIILVLGVIISKLIPKKETPIKPSSPSVNNGSDALEQPPIATNPEEPKNEEVVPPITEEPKVEKEPVVEGNPVVKEDVIKVYPTGKDRDVKKNQIKILVSDLRIREGGSKSAKVVGYATKGKYYTYSQVSAKDTNGIKWYKVDDYYIGDSGSGDLAVCEANNYMIFPLKTYVWVSTPFSKDHPAVDFGWSRNYGGSAQSIVAPYDMKVVKEGYDSVIGNYIYAQTTYEGKKYTFRFIHLSSTNVSKGDSVKRGATIGKMGNTGSSCGGAHLHFDILSGHMTSLPSSRYANSNDAMKFCYAPSTVVVDKDTLDDFKVLKAD